MPSLIAIEMIQHSESDHANGVPVPSSMSLIFEQVSELTQA